MDAPMSSSLGAMGPLLRKLDLLLVPEYPLRRSLKQAIELLKEDLEEINAALLEQSMLESPSNRAKYWMNEVRELSYDIEDCIDDMMRPHARASAKVRSVHGHRVVRLKIIRLPKLLKVSTRMARIAELRALLRGTSERYERYQLDACSSNPPRFAFAGTHSRASALCKTSVDLIGVDDSRKELTDWLTNQEETQLKVLAIVGSAGIGKTTLVRAMYRELKGQFECRAFIRVSRKPDMSKLIGEILSQIQGPKQTSDNSALQNSIDSIRLLLQDKRYFVVIDELWDSTAWDILNNAFPNSKNCSRIIITAEVQDVFAECGGYHSVNFLEIKPLCSHDSEKLFLHRGFGFTHCPDRLKEVSCRIVKECRGLPLAIVTMASFLASELDNTHIWNQLLKCFSPSLAILTLEEMLKKIVNHCYNSLPQYLKTCLLYLDIYPEGSTIWKVDLLKQWIAEGFVSPTEGKEVVAESYFDELVNRGMIHPEKISHNDEVLSCTVHHSVCDLIRHKSSEEKFITAIDYSQTIPGFHMKAHRLSLHYSCAMYAAKPEGIRLSQIRSFAFFGFHRCMPSIIEFKRLRVLNLELWGDYDDCTTLNLSGLCRLFQLRYLKVVSHIFVELPSQIQGLQFLETLEIDAKVLATPIDLAYLPSLLHLSLRDGTKLHDGIGRITSLQTLQYFDIGSNSEGNVRSLGELINLQYLRLTCSQASSDEHLRRNLVALSSSLGRLVNLRSLILAPGIVDLTMFVDHCYVMSSISIFLQRLELSSPICTFSKFPEWIGKHQKLHTLKIIVRVLQKNDIDILAGLPVLTSVSLFVCRPASYGVVFHRGAFPVLKNFKYRCGALCLIFKDKALPNLQRLKLGFNVHRGGQYADMISGIEYLFNLKEINVEIGAAAGAEDSDRRAAEFALKKAIKKHPRFHYFINIKRVHWIEEEKIPVYELEDGYNWHKYGQLVKDRWTSPWSYYNCTFPGCPAKKMALSLTDGRIMEIVYKGSHNHSSATTENSSIRFAKNSGSQRRYADEPDAKPWKEGAEKEGSTGSTGSKLVREPRLVMQTLSDGNEPDAKGWKDTDNEGSSAGEGVGSKSVREPRIMVQTLSDVDIPDDGFRWMKYGKKVVKGNPYPRNYYKCATVGCPVRKHVDHASHDPRAVITTYEGKHNHYAPVVGRGVSSSAPESVPVPVSNAATTLMGEQQDQHPSTLEMLSSNNSDVFQHQRVTKDDADLDAFQRHLASLLTELHVIGEGEELEFLSVAWIRSLLEAFLACQEEFRAAVAQARRRGALMAAPHSERLMAEFRERAVKALDVFNAWRDEVHQVRRWVPLAGIAASVLLAPGEIHKGHLVRAWKALSDLSRLLEAARAGSGVASFLDTHGNRSFGPACAASLASSSSHFCSLPWSVSRTWSAARQLQAISAGMSAPRAHEAGLPVYVYAMGCLLHLATWALVVAVPCPDSAAALQALHLPAAPPRAAFPWAPPLLALQERLTEEGKRKDPCSSPGLLKEIDALVKCVQRLREAINEASIPLTGDREAEVREAATELAAVCAAMRDGLKLLERQVREVFHSIMQSRMEDLDWPMIDPREKVSVREKNIGDH